MVSLTRTVAPDIPGSVAPERRWTSADTTWIDLLRAEKRPCMLGLHGGGCLPLGRLDSRRCSPTRGPLRWTRASLSVPAHRERQEAAPGRSGTGSRRSQTSGFVAYARKIWATPCPGVLARIGGREVWHAPSYRHLQYGTYRRRGEQHLRDKLKKHDDLRMLHDFLKKIYLT
jgi:hypothetical protein